MNVLIILSESKMTKFELQKYCKTDWPPYRAIVMAQSVHPKSIYIIYGERRSKEPLTLFSSGSRHEAELAYESLTSRHTIKTPALV